MVRMEGLEPPRLSAPEPKSGVSTNFTTSATERRTRYEARDIEGSAYKYQGLFRKPCILRPLQMKIRYVFECVQRGCLNVNRFDVDLAAGLFFGSMANCAIQVALNRTKLEGLAAHLSHELTETELVSTSSRSYRHLVISTKTPLFGSR